MKALNAIILILCFLLAFAPSNYLGPMQKIIAVLGIIGVAGAFSGAGKKEDRDERRSAAGNERRNNNYRNKRKSKS